MRLNEVKTSALKMVYEEGGPRGGKPILLLHGWPDSPRTFDKVLPMLHGAGYRTLVPYLRGFGPTTFRSPMFGRKPRRTGQPVALAQDMIDLADALKLKSFDLVGHDWGARTAYALAALFPRRLERMVTLSVPFVPGARKPPALPQAQAYWYQWALCTKPGEKIFRADPAAFGKRQWDTWSPKGWYSEQQFAAAAQSWTNPDFADITLHAYRVAWGHAEKDPAYDLLQTRLESTPSLDVPTLMLHGMEDHCTLPESTDGSGRYFSNGYRRVLLDGVGHFPQRENPQAVGEEILRHLQSGAS
jgi:pimeloyl-ACP methyl ester carboxylesterase